MQPSCKRGRKARRFCQHESHPMTRKKPQPRAPGKIRAKSPADSRREARGHQGQRSPGAAKARPRAPLIRCPEGSVLVWGRHAAEAVLANPARRISAIHLAREAAEWFRSIRPACALPEPVLTDKAALSTALEGDDKAVHQGIVMVARMLEPPALEDWLAELPQRPVAILLDQVTDGRNIGAIMRSARAFGASALITTSRHAPPESAVMLRTASGAAEHIPLLRIVNLARGMEMLQDHGFTLAAMTARGDTPIDRLADHDRLGIIMGAEGKGLRRLTEERADLRVRIPIDDAAESLNVSAATAVALYAASRPTKS